MPNIYLDFETVYDDTYSLRKLSIEAYVRDARFEPLLLCYAIDDGPVQAVLPADIPAALDALHLENPKTRVYMHNGKFDGFILTEYYKRRLAFPLCTYCIGRYTGVSRVCRGSLAAQSEFLGTGAKGTYVIEAKGKRLSDFSDAELEQYIAYCTQDVALLRANAKKMQPYINELALHFISMTLKMYLDPIFVIDRPMLEAYHKRLLHEQEAAMESLAGMFHFKDREAFLKAVRSKKTFCAMLESLGGVVPYKLSEKKTATARAKQQAGLTAAEEDVTVYEPALAKNDLAFMALLESSNPAIRALAKARADTNSSMSMSRCLTYLDKSTRGAMPIALEAFCAHTGRYSAGTSEGFHSDATNIQNLKKRGDDKTLRQAIQVPAGMKFVACDSSQIEARVLAWLAGETWLLESFAQKEDPYSQMAAAIYDESYETIKDWTKGPRSRDPDADPALKKKYKNYRNIGKASILQLGYYAGATKLSLYLKQQGIHLADTDEEHDTAARHIVSVYRTRNAAIKCFWKTCEHVINMLLAGLSGTFGGPQGTTLRYDGAWQIFGHPAPMIELPDGYRLFYPNLRTEMVDGKAEVVYDLMETGKVNRKKFHAGICCNNITQALAFAIIRQQALAINTRYPIRINVHDSLGVVCREEDATACETFMLRIMRTAPAWAKGLPLDAESAVANDLTIA